jgi:hypothetical protein
MGLTRRWRAKTVAWVATAVPVAMRGVLPIPATVARAVLAATVRMEPRVLMVPTQVHLALMAVLAATEAQVARVAPAVCLWVRWVLEPLVLMVPTQTAVMAVLAVLAAMVSQVLPDLL